MGFWGWKYTLDMEFPCLLITSILVWGTFVVCLTITDSLCYSTTCDTVVITQAGCSALFTSMQDSMNFLTTYFNDLSSGTINDWSWDFGDGSTGNGQYPVHTYASIGTYRVCLTVTDTLNSCTNTYCTNVVANSPCALSLVLSLIH